MPTAGRGLVAPFRWKTTGQHLYETRRSVILLRHPERRRAVRLHRRRLGLNLVEAGASAPLPPALRLRPPVPPARLRTYLPGDVQPFLRLELAAALPARHGAERPHAGALHELRDAAPVRPLAGGTQAMRHPPAAGRERRRDNPAHLPQGGACAARHLLLGGSTSSATPFRVIVARLPFSSPGEPVLSARCDSSSAKHERLHALSLPSAVLRLRQGSDA